MTKGEKYTFLKMNSLNGSSSQEWRHLQKNLVGIKDNTNYSYRNNKKRIIWVYLEGTCYNSCWKVRCSCSHIKKVLSPAKYTNSFKWLLVKIKIRKTRWDSCFTWIYRRSSFNWLFSRRKKEKNTKSYWTNNWTKPRHS